MAEFHFVEDYRRYVSMLMSEYPLEDAMNRAVGLPGQYDSVGTTEREILLHAGLQRGMSIVDLGCGSGRLAHALGKSIQVRYTGIDVVQALLDYAATKSPDGYRFVLNETLTLPVVDGSVDFLAAFSVFTHLLHSESYIYLEEARRKLKPGGRVVFSFLEFADPNHWYTFMSEVNSRRSSGSSPLNSHIERPVIELWAKALGYDAPVFVGGKEAPWGGQSLGQAVAILGTGERKEDAAAKRPLSPLRRWVNRLTPSARRVFQTS